MSQWKNDHKNEEKTFKGDERVNPDDNITGVHLMSNWICENKIKYERETLLSLYDNLQTFILSCSVFKPKR